MIYSTFSQIKSLYIVLLFGLFVSASIYLFKIILVYNQSKTFFKNLQNIFFTSLAGIVLICAINLYNYGEYNIILMLCYLLEIYYLNFSLKKSLAFLSDKVYHIYIKILKKGRIKIARKFRSIQD